jgi:hypothetical protein
VTQHQSFLLEQLLLVLHQVVHGHSISASEELLVDYLVANMHRCLRAQRPARAPQHPESGRQKCTARRVKGFRLEHSGELCDAAVNVDGIVQWRIRTVVVAR